MQLQAREKRVLIFGAVVIVCLLAYLLWPAPAPPSSVELVPAAQRTASAPAAAPIAPPVASATPPAAPPPPVTVTTVSAAPAAPAATAPGSVPPGLMLAGVAGGGAIFAYPDGSQRYIPRGREVAPGVTLQGINVRGVILAAGTTNYRLGFGGTAVALGPSDTAGGAPASSQVGTVAPPRPGL